MRVYIVTFLSGEIAYVTAWSNMQVRKFFAENGTNKISIERVTGITVS